MIQIPKVLSGVKTVSNTKKKKIKGNVSDDQIYDTNISVKYYKYIINWISSSKIFSKSKDQKSSEFKKKKTPVQSFSSALQLSRYFRATRKTILNLQVYPDG